MESGTDRAQLVPAIDIDSLSLARLWRLARAGTSSLPGTTEPMAREVIAMLDALERDFETHTGELSLRAWLKRREG